MTAAEPGSGDKSDAKPGNGDKSDAKPGSGEEMRIEVALVRQLAALLDETNLTEIEVQDGERAVRVARQAAPAAASAPLMVAPVAAAVAATTEADHPGTIRSPMVGTAYLSAEPGGKPLVTAGATVKEGETLLIVEAMKVMNPIIAPRAGTLKAILVVNEQPVEYDQPLAVID